MEEEFQLDISTPSKKFKEHLDLVDNHRIIFSGIYGIGKTYFLKEFFKKNQEKYNTIHLFPVNYSVSRNKDVFELIKYDIFYEFLGKGIDFEKIDISFFHSLPFFLNKNFKTIISPFLVLIPKLGKQLLSIYEGLDGLAKKYNDAQEELEVDDRGSALKFLRDFEQQKGTIYENDFYTELIAKMLFQLSGHEDNEKENILIIDDLDRVDPKHVFRLLNVFAAHFDVHETNENKFGFSKVIFVCDVDNVRQIFYHVYGQNLDFSGYIDKFYSREIYNFDNTEIVKKSIEQVLKSISIDEKYKELISFKDGNNTISNDIHWILAVMINANAINLRTLLRLRGKEYPIPFYEVKVGPNKKQNWQFPIIVIFDFLKIIFGSADSVFKGIEKCRKYNSQLIHEIDYNDREDHYKVGSLLAILDLENHGFKEGVSHVYVNNELDISYEYSISRTNLRDMVYTTISKVYYTNGNEKVANLRPVELLFETAKKLKELKIL